MFFTLTSSSRTFLTSISIWCIKQVIQLISFPSLWDTSQKLHFHPSPFIQKFALPLGLELQLPLKKTPNWPKSREENNYLNVIMLTSKTKFNFLTQGIALAVLLWLRLDVSCLQQGIIWFCLLPCLFAPSVWPESLHGKLGRSGVWKYVLICGRREDSFEGGSCSGFPSGGTTWPVDFYSQRHVSINVIEGKQRADVLDTFCRMTFVSLSFHQSVTNSELELNSHSVTDVKISSGLNRRGFLSGACWQVIHEGGKGWTPLGDCLSSQLYSLDVKFSILPATFIFVSWMSHLVATPAFYSVQFARVSLGQSQ